MKELIFAAVGLAVLFTACKKDDPNGDPCHSAGKKQAWKKDEGNPVFVRGENSWDDGLILGHSVIKSGSTYKMWYSGGHGIGSLSSIGYAASTDGIHWIKYSGNPVFNGTPGSWDQSSVGIPSILQDGNTLHMWYLGGTNPDGGTIGYATSQDGIHWNSYSSPVLQSKRGEWYADGIFPGTVLKENGIFKMWFSGSLGSLSQGGPTSKTGIGYATSLDGINWTFYNNPATTSTPYQFSDPVLNHGTSAEWDASSALAPSVVKTKCGYEMWYAGEIYGVSQNLGYATSSDGITWTKYAQNPVLMVDTWNIQLVFPSVILDGNKYRMWYGGFFLDGDALGGAIGYATMPASNK